MWVPSDPVPPIRRSSVHVGAAFEVPKTPCCLTNPERQYGVSLYPWVPYDLPERVQ